MQIVKHTKGKTYVHVNQHMIKRNKKDGTNLPVLTVKRGKMNVYGNGVEICGPSRVVYGGNDKPLLACGARVVIETEADVVVYDE